MYNQTYSNQRRLHRKMKIKCKLASKIILFDTSTSVEYLRLHMHIPNLSHAPNIIQTRDGHFRILYFSGIILNSYNRIQNINSYSVLNQPILQKIQQQTSNSSEKNSFEKITSKQHFLKMYQYRKTFRWR